MVWRRSGDKLLSEPMIVSLLTHICVTRPQWVKQHMMIHTGENPFRCSMCEVCSGKNTTHTNGAVLWNNCPANITDLNDIGPLKKVCLNIILKCTKNKLSAYTAYTAIVNVGDRILNLNRHQTILHTFSPLFLNLTLSGVPHLYRQLPNGQYLSDLYKMCYLEANLWKMWAGTKSWPIFSNGSG